MCKDKGEDEGPKHLVECLVCANKICEEDALDHALWECFKMNPNDEEF